MAEAGNSRRDALYAQASADHGAALDRLARAYEPDPERRRDLLQEIHLAIWRSFERFDARCSVRTWVYRVAHNTATSQIVRRRANAPALVGLEAIEALADGAGDGYRGGDRGGDRRHVHRGGRGDPGERRLDEQRALERLLALIQRLEPLDRQVMLLYLEGEDAAGIGEVTGLSSGNVATKVHRIKKILVRRFHEGGRDGE